jgi:hypothetical protein
MSKRFDDWEVVKDLPPGGQAFTYLVKKADGEGDELFVLKQLRNRANPSRVKRFQQGDRAGGKQRDPV